MKKIIFSLLLVLSFSYSESTIIESELEEVGYAVSKCASKNMFEYINIMSVMAMDHSHSTTTKMLTRFVSLMENKCKPEYNILNEVLSNYSTEGRAIFLLSIIKVQMILMSEIFKDTEFLDKKIDALLKKARQR